MTSRTRSLILGLALLGLVFSAWAAYVHYRLLTQPNYISPCDISATFNCSEVYLSQYGSVGGVSVALVGVVFFVLVAMVAGLAGGERTGAGDATGTYVFALSTVGLATILYLGWASYFVLGRLCALCLGTYAAVIALFIVSGRVKSIPLVKLPGRLASDLSGLVRQPVQLFVSLLAVALAVLMIGWFPTESTVSATGAAATAAGPAGVPEGFDALWEAQPRTDLGVPADGAKVVVVKFIDWQCPSCRAAHYAYKPILDKYEQTMPGAVKSVVKDYPLSNACNFSFSGIGHAGACAAAAAVRLAAERGKDQETAMVEWLFANQSTLSPQTVEAQARSSLGITDFAAQYARVLPDIRGDVADGIALDVRYTPTYYINGVKAQTPDGNWIAAEYLRQAIQYELRKAAEN
jgi:uncharacterized membrane protein/protein-disulfide isomerase